MADKERNPGDKRLPPEAPVKPGAPVVPPKTEKVTTRTPKGLEEKEQMVEVNQGNIGLVTVRLLGAINNNLIEILRTLRGEKK